jgi:hypothetical protein
MGKTESILREDKKYIENFCQKEETTWEMYA